MFTYVLVIWIWSNSYELKLLYIHGKYATRHGIFDSHPFVLHNPVWTDSYELRSSWAVFLNSPSHKIEISTCQFRLPADKFTKFRLEHAFINNVLNLRHVHRPAVAPRLTQHVMVRTKAGYHFGLHKILAYDIQWLPLIVPTVLLETNEEYRAAGPKAF